MSELIINRSEIKKRDIYKQHCQNHNSVQQRHFKSIVSKQNLFVMAFSLTSVRLYQPVFENTTLLFKLMTPMINSNTLTKRSKNVSLSLNLWIFDYVKLEQINVHALDLGLVIKYVLFISFPLHHSI